MLLEYNKQVETLLAFGRFCFSKFIARANVLVTLHVIWNNAVSNRFSASNPKLAEVSSKFTLGWTDTMHKTCVMQTEIQYTKTYHFVSTP